MATYSGATCETRQNLQIDAGAFFKDFDMETDVALLASAEDYNDLLEEKGLGATQGGGNFSAVPTPRQIEIDGSDPITVYDGWTVTMTANVIEAREGAFVMAMGTGRAADAEGTLSEKYRVIRANRQVSTEDYIDNITWIGSITGYTDPVIIQIYNAISTSGIVINMAPKANALIPVTFTSSVDICKNPEFADKAPFAIYYPKTKVTP